MSRTRSRDYKRQPRHRPTLLPSETRLKRLLTSCREHCPPSLKLGRIDKRSRPYQKSSIPSDLSRRTGPRAIVNLHGSFQIHHSVSPYPQRRCMSRDAFFFPFLLTHSAGVFWFSHLVCLLKVPSCDCAARSVRFGSPRKRVRYSTPPLSLRRARAPAWGCSAAFVSWCIIYIYAECKHIIFTSALVAFADLFVCAGM